MIIKCSKIRFFVLFLLDSCIMIIVPQFIMHNMKNNSNGFKSWPRQSSEPLPATG